MEKKNANQQQSVQVEIKQNPPTIRLEVHPIHQKLVVRDIKTGQYTKKR